MSSTGSPSTSRISSTSSPAIVRRSASSATGRSNGTYSRSHEIGTSIIDFGLGFWIGERGERQSKSPIQNPNLELVEHPEIVLKQQANVVNAVPEHRHAIQAEAA